MDSVSVDSVSVDSVSVDRGGMADGDLLTIGELARLTGLKVKTIRFWSDAGLVPPADRTPAGYRLYGPDALVRLGLVRTLAGHAQHHARRRMAYHSLARQLMIFIRCADFAGGHVP